MSIVAKFEDLKSGEAQRVMVDGAAVALVRNEDEVFAVADLCSHANVSLSEGTVMCETKHIECFKHGSAFSLETGIPDALPATKPVAVFSASVVDGNVVVESKDGAQ